MNLGRNPADGRYIVDIDGSLRATNLSSLSPRDVIALHGGIAGDAAVSLEMYDELVLVGPADRIMLHADTVAFFRTSRPKPMTFPGMGFVAPRTDTIAVAA